jgi:hypothetical protein
MIGGRERDSGGLVPPSGFAGTYGQVPSGFGGKQWSVGASSDKAGAVGSRPAKGVTIVRGQEGYPCET